MIEVYILFTILFLYAFPADLVHPQKHNVKANQPKVIPL